MKVSIIATVKNEENNIKKFIESIIKQTKKPNEFIIFDGGSNDKTFNILENYSKKYKWIKLYKKNNITIGKGRNLAIKKSKNNIIAVTDAGCILNKNWLKEITNPFKNKEIYVVGGVSKSYYTNNFEYIQGLISITNLNIKNVTVLSISNRSIAFRKNVWEKIKGYPNSSTGEDTKFCLDIYEKKYKFFFAKKAIVNWRMRKNLFEFIKQFYKYGVGDKKVGNLKRMRKNTIMIFSFWIYISLIILSSILNINIFYLLTSIFILYFIFGGIKIYFISKKINGFIYGFTLKILKRISYILGATFGI